jgi:hypothetical protein
MHTSVVRSRPGYLNSFILFLSAFSVAVAAEQVSEDTEAASNGEPACASGLGVPLIKPESVAFLASRGVQIKPLDVLGAEVFGMDLRSTPQDSEVLAVLQEEMARRGYIVFRDQGVLSGDEQVREPDSRFPLDVHTIMLHAGGIRVDCWTVLRAGTGI